MTNESQQVNNTDSKPASFSNHLRTSREAQNLTRADVAAQLRLNEKYIIMMEKDRYPADLPVTFVRGYLRAYANLLQIPEFEIKKAIELIKPKPTSYEVRAKQAILVTNDSSAMPLFSLFTLLVAGLIGIWCYNHHITLASIKAKYSQRKSMIGALPPPSSELTNNIATAPPPVQSQETNLHTEVATEQNNRQQPISSAQSPVATAPAAEPASSVLPENDEGMS
jgi:cytoskeleton protein RodZ